MLACTASFAKLRAALSLLPIPYNERNALETNHILLRFLTAIWVAVISIVVFTRIRQRISKQGEHTRRMD